MNILFLTYQGGIAGSTFSVSYLTKGLAEKGHNVFLGCKPNSRYPELLKKSKVKIRYLPFESKFDINSIRMIRDIVRENDIEIINSQASKDRYLSIWANKLFNLKCKIVHTRRQKPNSSGKFLQGLFYSWGTDKIVAVSQGVKKNIIDSMGINENHIRVIHNGTPKEKYEKVFDLDIGDLKNKFDISNDEFIIGCVSRKKQQEQLIKALNHIKSQKLKVIFVGIKRKEIDIEEKDFPKIHEIIFTGGRIDPQETLRYYRLFDIHVLPSITEGLSQTLLESMFMNVPVIATNAAGNPDLIKHNETGLLFENENSKGLAEEITKLITNRALYEKLRKLAKEKVLQEFSIDRVVENYEAFFQGLVSDSPRD